MLNFINRDDFITTVAIDYRKATRCKSKERKKDSIEILEGLTAEDLK